MSVDHQARLRDVPHKPGVYVMRDRFKRVIYVGKARDLRKRLANYFTPSRAAQADIKTRALIDSIWEFEWHIVKSDAEAVLYEGRLIKEFRPKYNISFKDDKRFLLVRVNLNEAWPRFHLTRLRKDDGSRYFGPFAHSGALRTTLNALRRRLGIRSCLPAEPTERDYKHCHDDVIRNCSAPCMARITREEYHRRVVEACELLDGQASQMTAQVEEEMKKAAEKLDFEKAAQLRNLLADLKRTTKPMTRFTRKTLPSAIHPEEDLAALADALQLGMPPRIMECFDISNISNTHIVASMVRFKDGVPDRAGYRRYRIRGTPNQNDFASMAEVVRRRYSRVLRESALKVKSESAATEGALGAPVGKVELAPPTHASVAEGQVPPCPALDADGLQISEVDYGPEYSQELPTSDLRTPTSNLPDLIIVDGGKGQLSSACKELQTLGLFEVPIIGLAKEFEEIHRPGRPLPLILSQDDGALKLLQRIRDEAHRFANGFHTLLLKKRMSESLLDDIPGVSESRKKALLTKFGSVERMKKLPPATLAEVRGISPRLGEEIAEYLTGTKRSKSTDFRTETRSAGIQGDAS